MRVWSSPDERKSARDFCEKVLNLKVDDVNLEEELLIVRQGKGGKDRVVPLSAVACKFLETYLNAIRPELLRGHQTKVLFVSMRFGYTLGEHSIGHLIKKYTQQAKVKKHVTAHLWRHSCAKAGFSW